MSVIKRLNIEVPFFKEINSFNQKQTKDSFAFKWAKRDTYESEAVKKAGKEWLLERYFGNNEDHLVEFLNGDNKRKIILDAGCGSGYSALLLFGDLLKDHDYLGVDISEAVNIAKERFLERDIKADFIQSDLMQLDFIPDSSIDIIFSEGVLHHTDSTEKALKYVATKLKKDGYFLFYVYNKKSVIREFTDDYIREQLLPLDDEAAWKKLEPLTKLGKVFGDLNINIEIPEDIDLLEIKKGPINLQRFFYWNICKLYYRSDYNLDEMNHINFDWFRPLNCHRQTSEQVKQWCIEAGLEIQRFDIQESGITVVAKKYV